MLVDIYMSNGSLVDEVEVDDIRVSQQTGRVLDVVSSDPELNGLVYLKGDQVVAIIKRGH